MTAKLTSKPPACLKPRYSEEHPFPETFMRIPKSVPACLALGVGS